MRGSKLDYGTAKNLYGRSLTLGEVIAHSISLSRIDAVISAYTYLLPDFLERLGSITERWIEEREQPQEPILADATATIGMVGRMMLVRHILTHELPDKPPYQVEDIAPFLTETAALLQAIDWLITAELYDYVPASQSQMNLSAANALDIAQKEMEGVLAKLRGTTGFNQDRLAASQAAWEEFAKVDAACYASQAEGGSMEPMLYAGHFAGLTKTRTGTLREWLRMEEGEY